MRGYERGSVLAEALGVLSILIGLWVGVRGFGWVEFINHWDEKLDRLSLQRSQYDGIR